MYVLGKKCHILSRKICAHFFMYANVYIYSIAFKITLFSTLYEKYIFCYYSLYILKCVIFLICHLFLNDLVSTKWFSASFILAKPSVWRNVNRLETP